MDKDKLRWGILGTGAIVDKMAPAIRSSGNGVLAGIAGRNEESGRSAAVRHGMDRSYRSYEELIRDPEIDAVYIALLNHLHMEWTIKALEAGKHVLCEKPMTMNEREVLRIQEAAKGRNLQVMEAFYWRFQPAHIAARELVREGAIGRPVFMHSHFSFPIRQETRFVKEWGGGALYDLGCYAISWCRFIMEEEPVAVDSDLSSDHESGVDTSGAGVLYYPDRTAFVSVSYNLDRLQFYEVLGERGKLRVESFATDYMIRFVLTGAGQSREWVTDRVEPYRYEVEAFADAILSGKPLPYDLEDARNNMRVIDAFFESAGTKRKVWLK